MRQIRYSITFARQLNRLFAVAVLMLLLGTPLAGADEQSKALIDGWMTNWSNKTKSVRGALNLIRFKDPTYIVTMPINWTPNADNKKYAPVTVPKGFVTDFASIPIIFWTALRPDGDYAYAAVIHDYLYWDQSRSREEADEIFLLAMQDFDIPFVNAQAIYLAVRVDTLGIGGGPAWRDITAAKAEGVKRILRKFPQDPRITWDEWRARSGVFK